MRSDYDHHVPDMPSHRTMAMKRILDVVGSALGLLLLLPVLAGDMSIVGPRPEVPEFMKFYTPDQRAIVLSIRPGITDYAAILFRDESSLLDQERDPIDVYRREIMPAKFAYYERYSREIGELNDLRIILATILLLVAGQVPHWLGVEYRQRMPPLPRTNEAKVNP